MFAFILAILLMIGLFYLLGMRIVGFSKDDPNKSPISKDYIIDLVDESLKTKLTREKINEIGEWRSYGKGYRGWCPLSKEEIEKWIVESVHIPETDFTVIKVVNGLNYIG